LKIARNLVGSSGIAIIEHIICRGHSQEDCARLVFGGDETQKPSDRDVNYADRRLREALSELAMSGTRGRDSHACRGTGRQGEIMSGDAGVRNMDIKPFVMR
jgi:hypothetical protein